MTIAEIIGCAIALMLLVCITFALARPERF